MGRWIWYTIVSMVFASATALVAIVLAFLALNGPITATTLVGGSLMLAGLFVVARD